MQKTVRGQGFNKTPTAYRRSQGAKEATSPQIFWTYCIVILCFERWNRKQNSVFCLKSNNLPPSPIFVLAADPLLRDLCSIHNKVTPKAKRNLGLFNQFTVVEQIQDVSKKYIGRNYFGTPSWIKCRSLDARRLSSRFGAWGGSERCRFLRKTLAATGVVGSCSASMHMSSYSCKLKRLQSLALILLVSQTRDTMKKSLLRRSLTTSQGWSGMDRHRNGVPHPFCTRLHWNMAVMC